MRYNLKLSRRLSARDIHVLNMYLAGDTADSMADYLMPDRRTKHEGKYNLHEIMRRLRSVLSMPHDRKVCIKNRDKILDNLQIIQGYHVDIDNYMAAQSKSLSNSAYADMSEL